MKGRDPVFAAIGAVSAAEAEHRRLDKRMAAALLPVHEQRIWGAESYRQNVLPLEIALLETSPTTAQGMRAKAEYFASSLPTAEDGSQPSIMSLADVRRAYGAVAAATVVATLVLDAYALEPKQHRQADAILAKEGISLARAAGLL